MEPNKAYKSTSFTIYGKDKRPTYSFKKAEDKARRNGSTEIQYYGKIIKTPEGRYKMLFNGDIQEKYEKGEISFDDINLYMNDCLKNLLAIAEKKKLKALTRTWKSNL